MSSTIIYIIAGYAILIIVVYVIQEKFIFNPEKLKQNFLYKYDAPFKELFFDVEKGVRINGLHFHVKNPHGLILYFHGNSRSIKGWAKYARDFYRYNYDVVLVDYRGFGKSTGKRGEKEMINDMQFVYDTLMQKYHENHMIVYGRSLGSGFATKLASENSPVILSLMRLIIVLEK
ncbi:MAG: alpha/beta fold hydrolase [Chitinophagaceae bacterium]